MRKNFTTNSSNFPPKTEELQFDEKWDFVYKKEKHCDENNPADSRCGDNWDHVAIDPEHRLVLEVVNGKRTEKNTQLLVSKTAKRLKNRTPRLITSDEYKPYRKAILKTFGVKRTPKRTGKRGRPKGPRYKPGKDLAPNGKCRATVHKTRVKGRVVKIDDRCVFGSKQKVESALKQSKCSRKINTAFIERHNGTDRNRCSRKIRKSYCFSKDWDVHRAATCLSMYSYNFWFIRQVRTLIDGWREF